VRDINIKATEYFEAVARLGTVTKAAHELDVSPSAVSQQVRLLEAQFGVKLFRREKQRLVLTLDGDRLFQTTTRAFSAIRNARSAIIRQHDARQLSVRVSPSFGVRWLGPRIQGFLADTSEWNIRIDATPDFSAFETEAVDVDLRFGLELPDPAFVEVAVFRFGIDRVKEHFHLPFKFTPWGFSLFRGGA
jgi:DNA-binding transcriptional LysR family regulator